MAYSASWIMERLQGVPPQADAALVLRHAEREDIPPGTFGAGARLTPWGVASTERLGAALSAIRPEGRVVTSPALRCVSTAEAMLRGGGRPEAPILDRRLGDPGPFVVDAEVCGPLFLEVGAPEVARRQLARAGPPAGMRDVSEGVDLLLGLTVKDLRSQGRLNVYVTHDSILAVLAACLFKLSVDEVGWPGYLDGLLAWRSRDRLHLVWRGLEQASHPSGG